MYQSSQSTRAESGEEFAEAAVDLEDNQLLASLAYFFKLSGDLSTPETIDELILAVRKIIDAPTGSSNDLKRKIYIWRKLVDESIFDTAAQSLDESLLISILGDVERFLEE